MASQEGLKMSTDWNRTLQSHLYLPRSMFRTYQLQAAPGDASAAEEGADAATVTLAVPLPQLMELLELCRPFGKSSPRSAQDMIATATSDDLAERSLFTLEWSPSLDHLSFR